MIAQESGTGRPAREDSSVSVGLAGGEQPGPAVAVLGDVEDRERLDRCPRRERCARSPPGRGACGCCRGRPPRSAGRTTPCTPRCSRSRGRPRAAATTSATEVPRTRTPTSAKTRPSASASATSTTWMTPAAGEPCEPVRTVASLSPRLRATAANDRRPSSFSSSMMRTSVSSSTFRSRFPSLTVVMGQAYPGSFLNSEREPPSRA